MVTSRNAVAFVNIHPQKSKWVTAKIILVSPASILVGEWLQRQRHIGAWPLYILFKCDVRHRLHCFVCTDTHLFNFTKGKTDLVNQRWRRTTCLKHQCYDVGCYPWLTQLQTLQVHRSNDAEGIRQCFMKHLHPKVKAKECIFVNSSLGYSTHKK